MATYPAVAKTLLDQSFDYKEGNLSLEAFKSAVWESAQQIVDIEERSIRDFLQRAEGQLDLIEHTTDSANVFAATMSVVEEIEERLKAYLSPG